MGEGFAVGVRYCPWCDGHHRVNVRGECSSCGNSKDEWVQDAPLTPRDADG